MANLSPKQFILPNQKRIVVQQWKNAKGAPTPPLAKPSGMPPSSTPPGK